MAIILDQLSAWVIGTIVLFMLLSVKMRAQETTMEHTLFMAAKTETLDLAATFERDLENIGFGAVPGDVVIAEPVRQTVDSVEFTSQFEFQGVDAADQPVQIRYTAVADGSTNINGEAVPLFRFLREENDGAGWTAAGGSRTSLTSFNVDLLDEANNGTDVAGARNVGVTFEYAVFPGVSTGQDRFIERFFWRATISPAGLRLVNSGA